MTIRKAHLVALALFLPAFLAAGHALVTVFAQLEPQAQMLLMLDPADANRLLTARGSAREVVKEGVGVDAVGNFRLPTVPGAADQVIYVRHRGDNHFDIVNDGVRCRLRPFPFLANDGIPMPSVVSCRSVSAGAWAFAVVGAALIAALFTWWVRHPDGVARRTLAFARETLSGRDLIGLAAFGLWAAYVSTGGDVPTIQENVSFAGKGVNIHQFQMQLEALTGWLANGGLPMLPYPVAAMAAILPFAELGRVFHFLAEPLAIDPAKFQQMTVMFAIWLTYCAAVLTFLRLFAGLGLAGPGGLRTLFYWSIFNPFLLFVIVLFGQIDVISVLVLALGSVALMLEGRPLTAAVLFGLATLLKVQHLFLVPLVLLLAFYWYRRDGAWLRQFGVVFAMLAALVVVSVWVQQTLSPDFIALADINPQIDRVDQALFHFAPGVGLLSIYFLVPMAMIVIAGIWPVRGVAGDHLAMFALMLAAVSALFQLGFLSTPGMYAFLILPVMAWLVAEPDLAKRMVFTVLSCLGTVSWSVSSVGDITRIFDVGKPGAITEYFRGLDQADAQHYSSVVLTLERAWLLALVFLAIWAAWRLVGGQRRPD